MRNGLFYVIRVILHCTNIIIDEWMMYLRVAYILVYHNMLYDINCFYNFIIILFITVVLQISIISLIFPN
jgi:hypothetical protein